MVILRDQMWQTGSNQVPVRAGSNFSHLGASLVLLCLEKKTLWSPESSSPVPLESDQLCQTFASGGKPIRETRRILVRKGHLNQPPACPDREADPRTGLDIFGG